MCQAHAFVRNVTQIAEILYLYGHIYSSYYTNKMRYLLYFRLVPWAIWSRSHIHLLKHVCQHCLFVYMSWWTFELLRGGGGVYMYNNYYMRIHSPQIQISFLKTQRAVRTVKKMFRNFRSLTPISHLPRGQDRGAHLKKDETMASKMTALVINQWISPPYMTTLV